MRTFVNTALVFLFIFYSTVCAYGAIGVNGYLKYNTGGNIVESKLNVHLVPHSHDDVGWLKTVDQYYVGSNNSIQGACVENVLDSVVMSLRRDWNRKFVFAEMVKLFFSLILCAYNLFGIEAKLLLGTKDAQFIRHVSVDPSVGIFPSVVDKAKPGNSSRSEKSCSFWPAGIRKRWLVYAR
ncbi:hypothetical protein H5410_008522 [Solanum commersonii]|uniref:Glycoside hydrolase family 38 N-terminal domain-containing protein n=1 Tax=Solanum commersonii TaxID=4109 RepID=A0A9J6AFD9_SOLCO|nr:hypothetical protein H5410_008522 [Solanum commersonii]